MDAYDKKFANLQNLYLPFLKKVIDNIQTNTCNSFLSNKNILDHNKRLKSLNKFLTDSSTK